AGNAGFIRNRIRAKSQRVARGSKQNYGSLSQSWWWPWARRQPRRFSARVFALRVSAGKCCHRSSHPECWQRFIHRLSFGSRTRNLGSANTNISSAIFERRYAQLAKNNGSGLSSEVEPSREVT